MNKKVLFLFLLGVLFTSQLFFSSAMVYEEQKISPDKLSVGDDYVDFSLIDFYNSSNKHVLSEYLADGKLVLLDLMASWCGPCQESMPEMNQLYDLFVPTNAFEIISIGVDRSESRSDLEWFDNTFGISWPMAQDHFGAIGDETFNSVYGTGYIPSYYLVSGDGKILYANVGWEGLDVLVDEVLKGIDYDESVNPVFSSHSNSIDNGDQTELSVDNPDISFTVNVTDNIAVGRVYCSLTTNDSNKVEMDINHIDSEMWSGVITIPAQHLYNVDNILIDIVAEDFFGNTAIVGDLSFDVTFVKDTELPKIILKKTNHFVSEEMNDIFVELTAVDNYYLQTPELLVTELGMETVTHTFEVVTGYSYELRIKFIPGIDLSNYTFELKLTDIGGNILLETLDITIKEQIVTLLKSDTTSDVSVNFSFILIAFIIIPIIHNKSKYLHHF